MNFRRLGRTGLNVSEIGLGSEAFVNRAEGESLALIQAAIGAGINYFDLYNPEPYVRDVLGKAMEGSRQDRSHLTKYLQASGKLRWKLV